MKIHHHFIFTAIICVLIYPFAGLVNTLITFGFGVLVDADHYLWYAYKFKKYNLKKAFKYFSTVKKADHILLPFHWVEWCIVLIVLSFYFELAVFALLGFTGHIILDFIQSKVMKPDGRNLSLVGWLVKRK